MPKILKESELKMKIEERAGRSLKESLVKSNPFKSKTCKDCQVCKVNPEASYKVQDKIYQIPCLESEEDGPCGKVYTSENQPAV
eukprot:Seg1185.2 transcript_id=Seg1185.2/GoldUCD/mRNA.D3Y31 product="hypothetical protein" protein_id=Seg1185.2/GoldUCD/D3Y31